VEHETYYERNPDFVYRQIVDEAVLVPIHKEIVDMQSIYTLNEVGAFIWENLDQPKTRADLQAALLDEYTADPDVLHADLERFLDEMTAIGALRKA
jgi:hypothetical protein